MSETTQRAVAVSAENGAAAITTAATAAASQAASVNGTAVDGALDTAPAPRPERSVAEIQAELDATRDRLAGRIDDLSDYVRPSNVLDRQVRKVKGVFVDEFGGIKPERVLVAAGVLVVGVALVVGLGRRRRGSSS